MFNEKRFVFTVEVEINGMWQAASVFAGGEEKRQLAEKNKNKLIAEGFPADKVRISQSEFNTSRKYQE